MKLKKILFLIFAVLMLSRFLFLGQDLPNYFIGFYTLLDSFNYTYNSFNLYFNGTFSLPGIPFIPVREGFELFEKIITYFSLQVFGNNFFGFLFPPVFLSVISITLLGLSLKKINDNRLVIAFILFYFITDFYFLLTSRVQSPVIYSVFSCILILYIFLEHTDSNRKNTVWTGFFLGMVSLGMILFVYMYTLFIYVALFFTLFVIHVIQQKQYKRFLLFIAGSFSSLILYHLCLNYLTGLSVVDLVKGLMAQGGGAIGEDGNFALIEKINKTSSLKELGYLFFSPFISMAATSFFRFNLSLLALFLIVIPWAVYFLAKSKFKDNTWLFFVSILLFCYLQTHVTTYYSIRKYIILLPVVLLMIAKIPYHDVFKIIKEKAIVHKVQIIYLFLSFLICFYVFLLTNAAWFETREIEQKEPTSKLFNFVNIGICVLFHLFLLTGLFFKHGFYGKLSKPIFLLFYIPGIFLSFQYIYLNPQYTFKNALLEINKTVKQNKVGGGTPYQFALYNNFAPLHSAPLYIRREAVYDSILNKLYSSGKIDYTVNYYYEKKEKHSVGDTVLYGKNYIVVTKKIINLWENGPKVQISECIRK